MQADCINSQDVCYRGLLLLLINIIYNSHVYIHKSVEQGWRPTDRYTHGTSHCKLV
jgi:hypothetical protein